MEYLFVGIFVSHLLLFFLYFSHQFFGLQWKQQVAVLILSTGDGIFLVGCLCRSGQNCCGLDASERKRSTAAGGEFLVSKVPQLPSQNLFKMQQLLDLSAFVVLFCCAGKTGVQHFRLSETHCFQKILKVPPKKIHDTCSNLINSQARSYKSPDQISA